MYKLNIMKAEELRIGNHVQFIVTKEPMRVLKIQPQSDFLYMIEPIPLTEEWLLKFGFKVNTPNLRWYHNDSSAEVYKTSLGETTMIQNGTYLTDYDIKHVHSLQNLYHALTGKELTLKQ